MDQLVSIIIPVYNVEDYLVRCLESIIHQEYTNLEIILVDDGSTDSSPKICDDYKKLDTRITVIHKENGGLSSARNAGIDIAKGKWLYFLDSDDWISSNTISDLVSYAVQFNCQITMGEFVLCKSEEEFDAYHSKKEVVFYNNEEALAEMASGINFVFYSCNRLYEKELFDGIRFPVGKIYEDMFIIYKIVDRAKKLAYIPLARYAYFQREGSIANSKYNSKQMDWYIAVKQFKNYCETHHSKLGEVVNNLMMFVCVSLINKILLSDANEEEYKNDFRILISEIKNGYRNYIFSTLPGLAINTKYKISISLLMASKGVYKKMLRKVFK